MQPLVKIWSISLITGQNVQKLLILDVLASSVASILNLSNNVYTSKAEFLRRTILLIFSLSNRQTLFTDIFIDLWKNSQ